MYVYRTIVLATCRSASTASNSFINGILFVYTLYLAALFCTLTWPAPSRSLLCSTLRSSLGTSLLCSTLRDSRKPNSFLLLIRLLSVQTS